MEYYSFTKTIHVMTVIISIVLFILRVRLLIVKSAELKSTIFRILPHFNDSILLFSAISLLIIGDIVPGNENPWVIAKIVAMVLYISIGFYIFKSEMHRKSIVIMSMIALTIYSYIVHTAITKSFNPFIY